MSEQEAVRYCKCGHAEWQHVWNSVPLPDGRGPFSIAPCAAPKPDMCLCMNFRVALNAGDFDRRLSILPTRDEE